MTRDADAVQIYLPYCDETPTGLLRFSSQLVAALRGGREPVEMLVGQVSGRPDWLEDGPVKVLFAAPWLRRSVFRPLAVVLRILWLQFGYPLSARGSNSPALLLLAHESAPFPWWSQVCVVHDLTALKKFSGRDTLLRRLQHAVWLTGLRRSRRIVAVSEATRRDLLHHHPELAPRISTIYEGVDRQVFNEVSGPGDEEVLQSAGIRSPYLLYAGTLARHKNIPLLIPVLERLGAAGEELTLVLAGRHTELERAEIRGLAEQHGILERLTFPGYLDDHALATLMRHSAAFVFPSLNEGFGLAPLEAMSCGTVVISSSAGSLPEVVGDGGVLISPTDPDAWVSALWRVLTDRGYRDSVAARGLERARELSWSQAADSYRALLTSTTHAR